MSYNKVGGVMKKIIYIILGVIMVVIGGIGVVVPGLPTTIFLILAAYFFTHSSPKLYKWLMNNKMFGPIITNYTKYHGITITDRKKAVITIWIIILISIVISHSFLLGSILLVVALLHTVFLYRLNTVL